MTSSFEEVDKHRRKVIRENENLLNGLIERDRTIRDLKLEIESLRKDLTTKNSTV